MCVFFVESCSGSLQSPPDLDHQIVTRWIILPLENPFSVPVFDAPLLPRGQAVPPLVGSGRESALPAPTAAQDPLGCRPSSPKICLGCDHGQLQPSPSPIHLKESAQIRCCRGQEPPPIRPPPADRGVFQTIGNNWLEQPHDHRTFLANGRKLPHLLQHHPAGAGRCWS